MASLSYDFAFGPSAAGLDAVITDAYTGVEIEDSPVELDSSGSASVVLAAGSYNGLVASADRGNIGNIGTNGVLNVGASVEAAALLPEA
jgi:hypothetical protein